MRLWRRALQVRVETGSWGTAAQDLEGCSPTLLRPPETAPPSLGPDGALGRGPAIKRINHPRPGICDAVLRSDRFGTGHRLGIQNLGPTFQLTSSQQIL